MRAVQGEPSRIRAAASVLCRGLKRVCAVGLCKGERGHITGVGADIEVRCGAMSCDCSKEKRADEHFDLRFGSQSNLEEYMSGQMAEYAMKSAELAGLRRAGRSRNKGTDC